ncbi:hypothetical protein WL307_12695, partial [Staphylococcus epidermidis]
TNMIINYCEFLNQKYYSEDINFNNTPTDKEQEMVRIFARYLLADHWEVLQLSNAEQYKYNCKKGYPNDKYSFIQKFNIIIIN